MKTPAQTPSEERLAHDVSELKKLGADAIIKDGGIVICGDLKVFEKQITNASIYEYVTVVKGDLSFPKMKIPPDNFMPNLKYALRTVYLRLEKTGNNFMPNLLFVGNKLFLHYIKNMTDDFMGSLIGVFRSVYSSSRENRMRDLENIKHVLTLEKRIKINRIGYYPEYGIAYFNRTCSLVERVRKFGEYNIYSLRFGGFIAEKTSAELDKYNFSNSVYSKIMVYNGKCMVRGESVKQAVRNLEARIYSFTLYSKPLGMDSDIDAMKYLTIFGGSFDDVQKFLEEKKIPFSLVKNENGNVIEIKTESVTVEKLLDMFGSSRQFCHDKVWVRVKNDRLKWFR